jgi:hypothetical protein
LSGLSCVRKLYHQYRFQSGITSYPETRPTTPDIETPVTEF